MVQLKFGAITVVLILGGCATGSIFESYPAQLQTVKQQIMSQQFADAQNKLDRYRDNADRILYMMERGRVSQIAGDYAGSIEDFRQVLKAMDSYEAKARISVSQMAAQGSALFTSDSAIPYKGDDYERVFVHQFQALNFLFQKNLEATLVEVRRANEWQQLALREHEKEVAEVTNATNTKAPGNASFMENFRDMETIASRVKNSFQNAYTFFVSGLVYELSGSDNDAYIDYKKALEIFPANIYLQQDVLRLAAKLDMSEDLERFKQVYPQLTVPVPQPDNGEIVVLFEQGFAPVKQEIKVNLFALHTIHSVAFPTYSRIWQDNPPLSVTMVGGSDLGNTRPIVFVQSLAAKALQEKLPAMMVRQVLRLVAKKQLVDQSQRQLGPGGQFAAIVFNVVTENADRRSWLTLPSDAQIMRKYLAAGDYRLRLSNGRASSVVDISVKPHKKTILHIIGTDATLHTDMVVL